MRLIYNFFFTIFFVLSAPFYFLKMWRRGNWRQGFSERFGSYDAKVKQGLTNRQTLWIHAVSVGEVNICTHLIQALEPRLPNLKIVVSTTTSTGMGELRKLPSHIQKIYYPIDRRPWATKALGTIHPEAVILVEAEIWPNFLWRCQDMRIPVFLINARLSARSARGYRFWSFLFRPLFQGLAGVGCQSEADAGRLHSLGCRPEAVRALGSLKFDAIKLDERRVTDAPGILKQIGFPADAPILVAGSTHAGEEVILAGIFLRLRKQFPKLGLVIAPRHAERSKEAGKQVAELGLNVVYRTELSSQTAHVEGSRDVLILNTTGELRHFYAVATVIFVGKSLVAHGGQNPIEPGALGKAMIFGPNMENFTAIAEAFVQAKGAIQVRDETELEASLARLLGDATQRDALGGNALEVVNKNKGAMERTVEMVVEQLRNRDVLIR